MFRLVVPASAQGIVRNWHWAGTPDATRTIQELCTAPRAPNTTGSLVTTGVVGEFS